MPLIRFLPAPDEARMAQIASRLSEFSLMAILSRRAATASHEQFLKNAPSVPPLVAMGIGTQKALSAFGYRVDLLPDDSNSESMAKLLIEEFRSRGCSKPILILRANRGSNFLPTALREAQIPFEELAVYQSVDVTEVDPAVLASLSAGEFDWLTVTSSSIARNAAKLFDGRLGSTKIASISPTTTRAATESGLVVAAEALKYDVDGLLAAIVAFHSQQ